MLQILLSNIRLRLSYPTSLALVMDEFLDIDLGDGAPSYSESDRYRKDSRLWWWRPPTWLWSTRGALAAAPAIGDEEVPPPPASTSKLEKEERDHEWERGGKYIFANNISCPQSQSAIEAAFALVAPSHT